MQDFFTIAYNFKFSEGEEKKFDVLLDRKTLSLVAQPVVEAPAWALLEFHQCENCPLDHAFNLYCPVAANLSGVAREFREVTASAQAKVTVTVKERSYFKTTTIQEGLSPLLGIIMTTSGCPVMDPLKPMVRFHLPFASLDETVFRMIAMFLVAQFIREQHGKDPHWQLDGLRNIYAEVKKLNRDFGKRMIAAAQNDANVHALVKLNVFAVMVPMEAEKVLKEMAPCFSSYLG